jgi:N-acetylglucosamine-6-sulfatase
MRRGRGALVPAVAGLVVAIVLGVAAIGGAGGASGKTAAPSAAASRPNVVFILTDDLAWNLVRYMPNVRKLQRRGATFSRYFVTDSLCCPSRSSIFTGAFPHNSGIFTNTGTDGGFQTFLNRGLEQTTYATAIQPAGYRTAMMGKYLNGYRPASRHVPPGWTTWNVAGNAYAEFNYNLLQNNRIVHYGRQPADYLTDVLAAKGSNFINQSADAGKPFVMELATFAPHAPYTPAPRDATSFPGLKAPRGPSFNKANVNPPSWLSGRAPLTAAQIAAIDGAFRKRAQAVQAVDDLIGRIRATLKARGLLDNTYIVFSSDNGYHMGEHRLMPGKMTAFDSDIRVPLVIAGPGVRKGRKISNIAENIDLNPTFAQLAGTNPSPTADGRSLVPLLRGKRVRRWRKAALIEHHGPDNRAGDPDRPTGPSGNPATYEAIRTSDAVYVEYRNGDREYYNLRRDPAERRNVYGSLSAGKRAKLSAMLSRLQSCRGASCSEAAR